MCDSEGEREGEYLNVTGDVGQILSDIKTHYMCTLVMLYVVELAISLMPHAVCLYMLDVLEDC